MWLSVRVLALHAQSPAPPKKEEEKRQRRREKERQTVGQTENTKKGWVRVGAGLDRDMASRICSLQWAQR